MSYPSPPPHVEICEPWQTDYLRRLASDMTTPAEVIRDLLIEAGQEDLIGAVGEDSCNRGIATLTRLEYRRRDGKALAFCYISALGRKPGAAVLGGKPKTPIEQWLYPYVEQLALLGAEWEKQREATLGGILLQTRKDRERAARKDGDRLGLPEEYQEALPLRREIVPE